MSGSKQPGIAAFFARSHNKPCRATQQGTRLGGCKRKDRNADDPNSQAVSGGEEAPPSTGSGGRVKQRGSVPCRKSFTQMHLDAGQAEFSMTTCKGCGMVYSPGHAADEAQHAQFHKSLTTGIRCQGWPNTRVVLDDRKQGRVLLVQPGDSSAALSKVQEVAAMLENQLGLQSVWLLAGTWQAFLYVTPASRLVGCVVAEPLSHAYAVMLPGTASALPQQQRQAAGRGPGEGAPEPQPQGSTAGAACSPQLPGALQTAGRQGQPVCPTADSAEQPPWPSAAMPPSSSGRGTQAAGHSHWALPVHPGSSGKPLPGVLTPGGGTQGAGGPSLQACSPQDSSQAEDCRHQAAASAHPGRQRSDPAAMGSISRGAGQAVHPQDSSQPDNCRDQAVSPSQGPPGKQRSDTAATGSISRGGGQAVCPQPSQMAVIMDTSRRMPASCGIRAVWTSVESRRQGVATKLLDACRCICVAHYIVPRSRVAFTQPTEAGAKLAASYSGTAAFLVY